MLADIFATIEDAGGLVISLNDQRITVGFGCSLMGEYALGLFDLEVVVYLQKRIVYVSLLRDQGPITTEIESGFACAKDLRTLLNPSQEKGQSSVLNKSKRFSVLEARDS